MSNQEPLNITISAADAGEFFGTVVAGYAMANGHRPAWEVAEDASRPVLHLISTVLSSLEESEANAATIVLRLAAFAEAFGSTITDKLIAVAAAQDDRDVRYHKNASAEGADANHLSGEDGERGEDDGGVADEGDDEDDEEYQPEDLADALRRALSRQGGHRSVLDVEDEMDTELPVDELNNGDEGDADESDIEEDDEAGSDGSAEGERDAVEDEPRSAKRPRKAAKKAPPRRGTTNGKKKKSGRGRPPSYDYDEVLGKIKDYLQTREEGAAVSEIGRAIGIEKRHILAAVLGRAVNEGKLAAKGAGRGTRYHAT